MVHTGDCYKKNPSDNRFVMFDSLNLKMGNLMTPVKIYFMLHFPVVACLLDASDVASNVEQVACLDLAHVLIFQM